MPEWTFFGSKIPSAEIVFFCQIVASYIIICTSLYNLTVGSDPANLWITLRWLFVAQPGVEIEK